MFEKIKKCLIFKIEKSLIFQQFESFAILKMRHFLEFSNTVDVLDSFLTLAPLL